MMREEFLDRWLNRFGLPSENREAEIQRHLINLPLYMQLDETFALIASLFGEVPRLLKRRKDSETLQIAEAFAWCCFGFWQGRSAFPAFAESYAAFLKRDLFLRKHSAHASLVARMIVEFNSQDGQCWILFDTSQIVHRADAELTPGIAAFELLLDIIGLHRWMLDFLSELDW